MTDPSAEFPPYTHIPGKTPHPHSDPHGHAYGFKREHPLNIELAFQRGMELFQHGFYWEAHEEWEQVWIELGRKGDQADYVKGLIKLAASGVKCLERNLSGAKRHLLRAHQLLAVNSPATHPLEFPHVHPEELFSRIERMVQQLSAEQTP